jgi:hypothetical protein
MLATGGAGGTQAAVGSGGGGTGGQWPLVNYCTECSAPATAGKIANASIDEASGLVASRAHPGVYYVHNDSGDQARFYAIDHAGNDLGQFDVVNALAIDWEDLAIGPCDTGHCLFLGDFGDNSESRTNYVVYRVPEPDMIAPGKQDVMSDALAFEYPDGSHNAEALLADPNTGQLYLVTKVSSGASGVYRFPKDPDPNQTSILTKVGTVQPPQGVAFITGGDAHHAGVLLRTYTHLLYYRFLGNDIATALAGEPCALPKPFELQGETVAWAADALSYLTVSEGKAVPVYQMTCASP